MGTIYVVMGVSGVGKTTIGKAIAKQLQVPFYDADDFHPQKNKDKMASGVALQDEDRWPWLDAIVAQYPQWKTKGAVLACSALKEKYRKRLEVDQLHVKTIYLSASCTLVKERLAARTDHFFNPDLLQSQFDALEAPRAGIICDATMPKEALVKHIMNTIQQQTLSQLGLIGLGVMGKSLSRNFANHDITLSLYNRHLADVEENVAMQFVRSYPELQHSKGFDDIEAFVNSLALPRKIFLMVNSGPAVDAVIASLEPYLSKGDIIMDGGNSHYLDTERRVETLQEKGIHFMGVGVSGGEEGALKGPSIMPSGTAEAYKQVGIFLETIAARDAQNNACCARVGAGGSGHFIKMIHNGIEYAEMQLIAEVYDILHYHCMVSLEDIAHTFDTWNAGEENSYLLEISSKILRKTENGQPLIDVILDKAQQKGTGSWSTTAALQIGTPFDTIAQAVLARIISSEKVQRVKGQQRYKIKREEIKHLEIATIKSAYQTARIINHAIGFETLRKASIHYKWELHLSEIARIWTNGCIIRSKLMQQLIGVLDGFDDSILFHESVIPQITKGQSALKQVVPKAVGAGAAIPVFSASLSYFNAMIQGDSSASMIQAQRDFFGAHTYERKDREGSFHTVWDA
ncbi:NADP-dependent phosphogluconate dehydrogenase [uncultured Dokdonia sp.]|uniref:NADP-dependent phosphogluconate dehydrogenase n=1 Tax=uncultured Dokdonia sp. TaxID=575653 RepID=UPI00262360A9|nr:NADP-dependent phosphogluconate dehydrogenase [uncultured Dokdonia sp.]